MEFILIGQPNCGKSTIFNEVVGYKSITNNIPGSTVEYTKGNLSIENTKIDIIDLPGIYSLIPSDDAEKTTVNYLLDIPDDSVIINIIDASVLSRSLELTLQLMEFERPMILVLNMMDEALKKGIKIDVGKLSKKLNVPIVTTVARKGEGVSEIFEKAYTLPRESLTPYTMKRPQYTEELIEKIESIIKKRIAIGTWKSRYVAIRLAQHDDSISPLIWEILLDKDKAFIQDLIREFEIQHGQDADSILSAEHHDMAFQLFERCTKVGKPPKPDIRERIDSVLMHPIFGYVFLGAILYATFSFIFLIGNTVEPLFIDTIEVITKWMVSYTGKDTFLYAMSHGFVQGFGGGIGIVVPFLFPFFIIIALIEDTGYLSRIAFLLDNVMHKIGLHGMSIIPIVLGYGCTVPAILATRILKSKRDQFITAALATLVPCAARLTVIFGLVAFFISLKAAVLVYVLNILILGILGKILSTAMPEVSPGLLMVIPRYHVPRLKTVLQKTWLRMKDFVIIGWTFLIIGSIVLELIKYLNMTDPINNFIAPFTSGVLGLPIAVGTTLIFGIMRKELSLILLFAALGTNNVASVMTPTQIYVFTIFVTFYIPCLATVAALIKELSLKKAFIISFITFLIAVILSVIVRIVFSFFNIV